MSTKFRHCIIQYNWKNPEKKIQISEKTFSNAFSKTAKKWFNQTVHSKFPKIKSRILDGTIAGYHFEIDDFVIELH